jgi:outer membrane protein insertion porin family
MDINEWGLSFGFSTGYRWSTPIGNVSLAGGLRVGMNHNAYNDTVYRPFDPDLRAGANKWLPSNSFWISASLDNRDIYYDPNKGFYVMERITFQGFGPTEIQHYLREETKMEAFFKLWELKVTDKWSFKGVLGLHTGLTFLFPERPGVLQVRRSNMLCIDGMFVGRGWSSMNNQKSLALWENWAELRIPIVPKVISWDFFFDAAIAPTSSVSNARLASDTLFHDETFKTDMRFSFGGGIRFTLAQFPFRFLLAWPFQLNDDGSTRWLDPSGMPQFVISFALSSY